VWGVIVDKIIKEIKEFLFDCKHMSWLFGRIIKGFVLRRPAMSKDAWLWMRVHWNMKSKRIIDNKEEKHV